MKYGFSVRALVAAMGAAALALAPAPPVLAAKARAVKEQPAKARATKKAAVKDVVAKEPETVIAKGSLFAIVLGPGGAAKRGQQPLKKHGLAEHYRYWQDLQKQGRIASAGPLGNDAALVILRARNQSEADGFILGDPAVKAHLFRGVARPYAPALLSGEVLEGKAASKR